MRRREDVGDVSRSSHLKYMICYLNRTGGQLKSGDVEGEEGGHREALSA